MASTSVDLADLVPDLVTELNVPGVDAYSTVSEQEWIDRLRNAFWYSVLDGLIIGYEDEDGIVKPTASSGSALSRELQQIVIMYAAINVVRNKLLELKTVFRAKAGSTEYETQQAASVLTALLAEFSERRKYILNRIGDKGTARRMYVFDGFNARQDAINSGYTSWIGA